MKLERKMWFFSNPSNTLKFTGSYKTLVNYDMVFFKSSTLWFFLLAASYGQMWCLSPISVGCISKSKICQKKYWTPPISQTFGVRHCMHVTRQASFAMGASGSHQGPRFIHITKSDPAVVYHFHCSSPSTLSAIRPQEGKW